MPPTRTLRLLLALALSASTPLGMAESTKEITYRGGIVRFILPTEWVEEYEPQGGATFYAKRPNSGILRLNVATLKAPSSVSGRAAQDVLTQLRGIDPTTVESLPSGNALARNVERSNDNGGQITLYWWYLSNPVPPTHLRIAMFSYTVLTSLEKTNETIAELKLLEQSIRSAKFNLSLGQ
jgi:hypothetical protein